MHCTTKRYSFSALLMSALIFTACSEGNPKQSMTPGGTAADAGASANPDAASNATPDSGIRTDAGPTGPCPPNFPGCRCSNPDDPMGMAMEPAQGTCVDPASVCAPYDVDQQTGEVSLGICIYQCQTDMDCAGKLVGNPGDNKAASLCRNIGADGVGVCVETEKNEDDRCRLHSLAGRKMEGCKGAATCFRLSEDAPGEGTCLQECSPTPMDPTGGCTGDNQYCNPRVFSRGGNPVGICSDKARNVGARCGGGYTKQCDTGSAELFCFTNEILDPNGQNPTFFTLGLDEGFCVETCDPDAPACPGTTDPALGPAVCQSLGTGSQGKLGLCSNECNKLTDERLQDLAVNACAGPGSEGNGRNCFAMPSLTINQMEGVFGQADICFDVLSPVTAESEIVAELDVTQMEVTSYRPKPAPNSIPGDCVGSRENGEIFTCPTGTFCSNLGSQQSPIPGCLRNCTTSSTIAEAPYEINECADSTLMNGSSLVCVPYAKTSTTPVDGKWFGFCAPAPN